MFWCKMNHSTYQKVMETLQPTMGPMGFEWSDMGPLQLVEGVHFVKSWTENLGRKHGGLEEKCRFKKQDGKSES